MIVNVTRRAWYFAARDRLATVGCEDAGFDAQCLLEDLGGLTRGHAPDETVLTAPQLARLDAALSERADGRPLQYILGEWDFLSLTLAVGEGVLIPRTDTECLCEQAARRLAHLPRAHVLDLCAGSGCVGLGVASLCPDVQVTAVEVSDAALMYLEKNVARYPSYAVTVRKADVLTDYDAFDSGWDAILSNPPYIPRADLDTLMREVQREPRLALDGDEDGLLFYRTIAAHWCRKLRRGGFCAVEVGIGQAAAVADLFAAAGLTEIAVNRDLGGVERVVVGVKK